MLISLSPCLSQNIEDLKLDETEIPANYVLSDTIINQSRAATYFKYTKTYSTVVGEVIKKDYQAFQSEKDSGTIFYYEFKDNLESHEYLGIILWGEEKANKKKFTEFIAQDNILIVWRFNPQSKIKAISKKKIKLVLHIQ